MADNFSQGFKQIPSAGPHELKSTQQINGKLAVKSHQDQVDKKKKKAPLGSCGTHLNINKCRKSAEIPLLFRENAFPNFRHICWQSKAHFIRWLLQKLWVSPAFPWQMRRAAVWLYGILTCQVNGCVFFKYGPCLSPPKCYICEIQTKKAIQIPGFGKLQLHCAGKLN